MADARVKTKEEVEAASAAKKAAADQQLLRELEDKVDALTSQLSTATEQLRSTDTALRYIHCAQLVNSSIPSVYGCFQVELCSVSRSLGCHMTPCSAIPGGCL